MRHAVFCRGTFEFVALRWRARSALTGTRTVRPTLRGVRGQAPASRGSAAAISTLRGRAPAPAGSGCRRSRRARPAARRSRRSRPEASPRRCASARTSLNPVWCGSCCVRPQAGTVAVAQHPQRARRQPEVDRVEDQHAARGRDVVVAGMRPSVPPSSQHARPAETAYAACSASTARTPNPSSAHSTLPMPSTSASQRARFRLAVTPGTGYSRERPTARRALSPGQGSRADLARTGARRDMRCAGARLRAPRVAHAAACMSHATCRCIQNAASLPKYSASRTAVSGVIARRPLMSSLTRRRETPSACGQLGLADRRAASGTASRGTAPGCGGWRDDRPSRAGRRGRRPSRAALSSRVSIVAGRALRPGARASGLGSRLNVRMPLIIVLMIGLAAHDVLADHHVDVDDREQQQVPHAQVVQRVHVLRSPNSDITQPNRLIGQRAPAPCSP